jgi:hypothetical protein
MPPKSLTPSPPRPPVPPAAPPGFGRRTRLGNKPKNPLRSFGPRFLKLGSLKGQKPDWCLPWPTFVGAHTSLTEQMFYAALCMVMKVPGNWMAPPYDGRGYFTYQDPLLGGRMTKGGQVCDFLVPWGAEEVCMRLQSEYFHLAGDVPKRADELFEKTHSSARIVDVFEPDFVADCSLEAACRIAANALAGRESANPVNVGTMEPTRRRGGTR